jgi:hypothetical protein
LDIPQNLQRVYPQKPENERIKNQLREKRQTGLGVWHPGPIYILARRREALRAMRY